MEHLQQLFKVKVSQNQLKAEIWYNDSDMVSDIKITEDDIKSFLSLNKISFGLIPANIKSLSENFNEIEYPVLVARGIEKEDGKNGDIKYSYDTTTEVDRSEGWNFREVMRIPSAKEGDQLATLIPPAKGKNGRSVYDKEITAKPGKPFQMKAGKNVTFNQNNQSFYANAEGQVSFGHRVVHVHNIYEVREDISMKTGNIDFLGTVVVKGDVPTGFSIKATGDIKVFGLIESAELLAGGSVYVSEGMAGLKMGLIEANEDVHIGYINQGKIVAGNSINVENSILHSNCSAVKDIICKEGNIIGGTLSAGRSITAKDVGNRMNTVTELSFGVNKQVFDKQQQLEKERETLEDNLRKLTLLKEKMNKEQNPDHKTRIMILKLRNSYQQTEEKIKEIDEELQTTSSDLGTIDDSFLKVKGKVYPNTSISFGKYRRKIDKNFENVTVRMKNNEITMF